MPIVDHQQHVSSNPLKLNDSTSNHREMYPHPCPRVSARHGGSLARANQHTSRTKGTHIRQARGATSVSGKLFTARNERRRVRRTSPPTKASRKTSRRLISKGHKSNEPMPCTSLSPLAAATTCPLATATAGNASRANHFGLPTQESRCRRSSVHRAGPSQASS